MNASMLIIGIGLGAVILVAALKAALGSDKKRRRDSDSGSVYIGDSGGRNKNDDTGYDGDSGSDGGGGD